MCFGIIPYHLESFGEIDFPVKKKNPAGVFVIVTENRSQIVYYQWCYHEQEDSHIRLLIRYQSLYYKNRIPNNPKLF